MKIDEAYPEAYRLAKKFHELYELAAPAFGYETKQETKKFIPESPNGRLMAFVCYQIVKEEKASLARLIDKAMLNSGKITVNSMTKFREIINGLDLE